jgi:formiminotetrahydrofolate cyclodeaminase
MSTAPEDLLALDVDELLDALSGDDPAPGSGSAAALVVAMAAALVSKAARRSREVWPEAAGATAQAHALRLRAAPLAVADARAFREALDRIEQPAGQDHLLGAALAQSVDVPLQILHAAADVAALAREVAANCDPVSRADAIGAAHLAAAAVRAAAHLVEVNLGATAEDPRVAAAQAVVRSLHVGA